MGGQRPALDASRGLRPCVRAVLYIKSEMALASAVPSAMGTLKVIIFGK